MNGAQYLKDKLPALMINLLGMLALALFLMANGNGLQIILFILAVWLLVLVLCMLSFYYSRKKYLNRLLDMAEQLEERYLLPEVMEVPERADDQVFYQLMKMTEKSMLERIGGIQRERKEYKEYIEQWIHEVKTPITAMKLIYENNPGPFTRDLMTELENVNRFTEQALYFARSEHAEKDYSVREIRLSDVVHEAIAGNKYLLRQNHVAITVEDMDDVVYFCTRKENDRVLLSVEDNGIGIPSGDLPRIFEKGFTGENGRKIHSSTGIGLYLCRRLCDKLGIGISASSKGKGTTISLSFHINDFVSEEPMEPILKLEHIQKYYGNGGNITKAINDISFSVEPGEFLGIMGASGSGKTTLLNCISTIDTVSAGHIYLEGTDITEIKPKSLARFRRENLGFVFQDFNLLDTLTISENIALALSINKTPAKDVEPRILDIAGKLNIRDILDKYPYQVSGGQKQRCACARAIVNNPKLLLADEPTGALDSHSSQILLSTIQSIHEELGATILMVTHDPFTASYANRILFLQDGEILTELRKGRDSRRAFFDKILHVLTMIGGGESHVC